MVHRAELVDSTAGLYKDNSQTTRKKLRAGGDGQSWASSLLSCVTTGNEHEFSYTVDRSVETLITQRLHRRVRTKSFGPGQTAC